MVWLRMEDNMFDHPKWRRALRQGGDGVLAVWFRLTSWCSRHLTDGEIPADMVDEVAETKGDRSRRRALQALIDSSLVARHVHGGCTIVDYLERNPSRFQVVAARTAAAKRKRKHRDSGDVTRFLPEESHDPATGRRNHPIPIPIPIPSQREKERETPPSGIHEVPDAPEPAQGQRTVWHDLVGWDASELEDEAVAQGLTREAYRVRVKRARNTKIGGRSGVFDRAEWVRDQLPQWRIWEETDRARAREGPRRSGSAQRDHGVDGWAESERKDAV